VIRRWYVKTPFRGGGCGLTAETQLFANAVLLLKNLVLSCRPRHKWKPNCKTENPDPPYDFAVRCRLFPKSIWA
jgi:hypothetical protein